MSLAEVLDHAYLEWASMTDVEALDDLLERKVREAREARDGVPFDETAEAQANLEAMLAL